LLEKERLIMELRREKEDMDRLLKARIDKQQMEITGEEGKEIHRPMVVQIAKKTELSTRIRNLHHPKPAAQQSINARFPHVTDDAKATTEMKWVIKMANEKHVENVRLKQTIATLRQARELHERKTRKTIDELDRRLKQTMDMLLREQLNTERWQKRCELFRERAEKLEAYVQKQGKNEQGTTVRQSYLVNGLLPIVNQPGPAGGAGRSPSPTRSPIPIKYLEPRSSSPSRLTQRSGVDGSSFIQAKKNLERLHMLS